MTKVWEETWKALHEPPIDDGIRKTPGHTAVVDATGRWMLSACSVDIGSEVDGSEEERVARAHLAAAAPELVRALIEAEWGANEYGPACREGGRCAVPGCPCCGGTRPDINTKNCCLKCGAWGHAGSGHVKDCALDAALRKAGVR